MSGTFVYPSFDGASEDAGLLTFSRVITTQLKNISKNLIATYTSLRDNFYIEVFIGVGKVRHYCRACRRRGRPQYHRGMYAAVTAILRNPVLHSNTDLYPYWPLQP